MSQWMEDLDFWGMEQSGIQISDFFQAVYCFKTKLSKRI